jgi:ribonuclease P protein component
MVGVKILSIGKSLEFKLIGKIGKKIHTKNILVISSKTSEKYSFNLQSRKNLQEFCRIGYTVAKTVSKSAVIRNKVKRRLKSSFAKLVSPEQIGFDYVIIAKKEILENSYQKIYNDLKFCLERLTKLK